MKHEDFAGKYWLWQNGLRFKILNKCDEYGSWIAECPISGKTWPVNPENMENSVEITETEAKKQYFDISKSTIRAVICSCCSWKMGKEELSIKMRLDKDNLIIPYDELHRFQDELREFFRKYEVKNILPYVYPTLDSNYNRDGGIELSFIAGE